MTRLEAFLGLKNHAWLKKTYGKLSNKEIDFCVNFLNQTIADSDDQFASKAVRMFLDKDKPKNWTLMEELLIACMAKTKINDDQK